MNLVRVSIVCISWSDICHSRTFSHGEGSLGNVYNLRHSLTFSDILVRRMALRHVYVVRHCDTFSRGILTEAVREMAENETYDSYAGQWRNHTGGAQDSFTPFLAGRLLIDR